MPFQAIVAEHVVEARWHALPVGATMDVEFPAGILQK